MKTKREEAPESARKGLCTAFASPVSLRKQVCVGVWGSVSVCL